MIPDGRALIHLDKSAFIARAHGRDLLISSLEEDLSPKRMLLVLDASKNVNAEAWKIETSLSTFVIDGAPPQLSFGLVLLNADVPPLDFATPRESLYSRLKELSSTRPAKAKPSEEDTYGGLMGALRLFGTPQFGDTIFAFFGGADESGRVNPSLLRDSFAKQGVRIFGFVLGEMSRSGFYMTSKDGDVPADPDTGEIGALAVQSGGLVAVENTTMQTKTYHLTDDRLNQLEAWAHRFYQLTVVPYRIRVAADPSAKPSEWSVDLNETIKKKAPGAGVLFPHQLLPCPSDVHR